MPFNEWQHERMIERRIQDEGHKRKFMVVLDDTPECDRAVVFAAKRAEHTGGSMTMLYVIVPGDFQHWLGVEKVMRAEAQDEAEEVMSRYVDRVRATASIEPEQVIREGVKSEEILKLIDEDEDIAILVLAAGTDKEGPGPLVTSFVTRGGGAFPIPLTIVPGTLTDEEIAALA